MKRRLRVYKKTVSIVNETAIGMYESLVGNKKGFLLESYDKIMTDIRFWKRTGRDHYFPRGCTRDPAEQRDGRNPAGKSARTSERILQRV